MSRIRSIHPGQWTDEDFVECSAFARLLTLGIRNEADDNGVFEWRATRLKMRLFPADAIDVGELLRELETRGLVMRFEASGRHYGAIRNFRVYQNPRSPKAEHPITAEADRFVGERAGDESVSKRGPGRPRKQQEDENGSPKLKSFPQNVENNSEREKERRVEKNNSPTDLSISEPIDERGSSLILVQPPAFDEIQEAFDAYDAVRREFVPAARSITFDADRKKKLRTTMGAIGGREGWASVLARIRGSPFLRGDTDSFAFATIDWLLKPANMRKIMEGNYDDRPRSRALGAGSAVDATARAAIAAGLG